MDLFSNWIVEFSVFLLPVFKETTHTHTHTSTLQASLYASHPVQRRSVQYRCTKQLPAGEQMNRANAVAPTRSADDSVWGERRSQKPASSAAQSRHRTDRRSRGESTVARNRRRKISQRTKRNWPFLIRLLLFIAPWGHEQLEEDNLIHNIATPLGQKKSLMVQETSAHVQSHVCQWLLVC